MISKQKRSRVYKKSKQKCVFCGSTNKSKFTIDHIIPLSKGGSNAIENMQTLCQRCNRDKGDELNYVFISREFKHVIKFLRIKNNKRNEISTTTT